MANPFDQFDAHTQAGPVYGAPPKPDIPSGYAGGTSGLQYIPGGPADPSTKTPTPQTPEQRANTVANTQQSQTSIANTRFDNVNNLRKQFESEKAVQDYKTVLPLMDSALKIQNNKAGDLNLVYAFGKVMDPGSVVREGEQVMATNVGGVSEKVSGYLSQINGGAQLTPTQRTELTEEIRNRTISLAQTYNQRRAFYEDFAKRNGVNPVDVTGPNPGAPFVGDEKSYITAHGGTPKIGGVPVDQPAKGPDSGNSPYGPKPVDLTMNADTPYETRANEYRLALYDATKEHKFKTIADMQKFAAAYNRQHGTNWGIPADTKTSRQALANANAGKAFNVDLPPDPAVQNEVGRRLKNRGDAVGAATVGAITDIPLINHLAAGVDAGAKFVAGQGNFGDNYSAGLDATHGYEEALRKDHPLPYFGGQIAGSVLLPAGEVRTPGALAKVGAAYGAAYGFDQGDPNASPGQRFLDTATGAAAGGATGYLVPKGFEVAKNALSPRATAVPPLVNSMTGQLNQPLEAMSPGQRVVKAEEYGINLPADAAGGRTAAVIGKGLDINPGSAGVMEDARRATESQVAAASDVVASRFGTSRTMNEAGAELQRGANERIERAKTVVGKAYEAIPIADKAPASTSGAVATLQNLTGRFESNPDLGAALKDPKLATYLDALQKGGLTWKDLKDFRTIVGEKIGDMRFGEGHSVNDLRALYAGLSEDMRTTAAQLGPRATRAFERANSLNRENEQLIQGALTRILGKDGQLAPEKAAAAVQAMTKGGKSTGDLKTLAQIRAATIKSGAWNEIASTLIRLGGQPANSAGRDFNPTTFVNWYADMAEPARRMLFGGSDLRQALDGFVAVNQRLMKVNALRNTSNTAGGLVAAGTATALTAPITMAIMGHPVAAATTAGVEGLTALGGYASAKLWTNPSVVRLFTGYAKAVASGNPGAVRSQIGRIAKLAATNPDLREPLIALQQRLANDNFTPSVAASTTNQADENQQR